MIYRVKLFSPFLPPTVFKQVTELTKGRLTKAPKGRWIVIELEETALRMNYKDVIGPLSIALKIEPNVLTERIVELLDKDKRLLAIMTNDVLFVHPESFGKVMIKIGKRIR